MLRTRLSTLLWALVATTLLAACGPSTSPSPSPSHSTATAAPASSATAASAAVTITLDDGKTITLPDGWLDQGSWDCCANSGFGDGAANGQGGADAVVIDFSADQASSVAPQPAGAQPPANASDAVTAWGNALSSDLSGSIANFTPGQTITRTEPGPAFDSFAGDTYTGSIKGSDVAGFITVVWNSQTQKNVMAWLITSDRSHADAAYSDLKHMLDALSAES